MMAGAGRRAKVSFRAKHIKDGGGRGRGTFQMTANFQRWTPTKQEADLLVDMLTARLSPAKICEDPLYRCADVDGVPGAAGGG